LLLSGVWLARLHGQDALVVAPVPLVTVSLNGSRETQIFPGTPVLLRVALLNSDLAETNAAPILLAADEGSWLAALQIMITDPGGGKLDLALQLIQPPNSVVTLDSEHSVEVAWWLTPERSATLPAGKYEVLITLDTTGVISPAAWHGMVKSVPAHLGVALEPANPSEEQSEGKQLSLARYAFFSGLGVQALAPLDQQLSQYPESVGALTLKSVLLTELGQLEQARQTTETALGIVFARTPNPPELPLELMGIQSRIQAMTLTSVVQSIEVAGQILTLSWQSQPDQTYQVEHSIDLRSWEVFAANIKAIAQATAWRTNVSALHDFFRVRQ
jgi:hypothetical protein